MVNTLLLIAVLVAIPNGNTLLSPKIDIIAIGVGNSNNLIMDEFDIPTPKPISEKDKKGKTIDGKDCLCYIEVTTGYLPPPRSENCICVKKPCCKERVREYLPPVDCEICPKCYCDNRTYTLINKETGNCPRCLPPKPKKCECHNGKYINEELGNCPVPCHPPPCRCVNGKYVNEESGNCPVPCLPPPCKCVNGRLQNKNSGNCPKEPCKPPCKCVNGKLINEDSGDCPPVCVKPLCKCVNGRLINENSGNCPTPCKPNCSCHKGKLINQDTGVCPTTCPYYFEKPQGYENLPKEFL